MTRVLLAIAIVAGLAILYLVVLGQVSQSRKPPGLLGGLLSPCPDLPNCACSEYADDPAHYLEPIDLGGETAAAASARLRGIVADLGGEIAVDGGDYIAATFRSALFGFVDDVEFRIDPAGGSIHLRSASRVGRSDLGVNRQRLERIRAAWRALRGGNDGGGRE